MATITFYGQGYGSTPVTVTATFDGTQIFTGAIATQTTEDLARANQTALFTVDTVDKKGSSQKNMTVTVSGGTGAIFGNIEGTANPDAGDIRSNVQIDGSAVTTPDPRPAGTEGTWWWVVPTGATMSCDVYIQSRDVGPY
jgi:hypothetical protein